MDQSSHELVLGVQRGQANALRQLLERHLAGLRAYVRLRLGPKLRLKESSADILQSVCKDVLAGLDTFEYENEASFKHWLYTRAEHKIVDRARYHERQRRDSGREEPLEVVDDAELLLASYQSFHTPSRDAIAREEIERLERAFARLPEDYREVILLHRVVGLSHAEVATRMGRSREAVWTLFSRALGRLSTLLES